MLELLLTVALAHEHKHPATPEVSGTVSIDSAVSGKTVAMVTTIANGKKRELQFQKSSDSGKTWTEATKLPADSVHAPNRGYFPQIAISGNKIAILYAVPGNTKFGGGLLQTLVSEDEGKTWSKGGTPVDNSKVKSAAFQDLTVDSKGNLHAVWLDGRDGDQGLRYAQSKTFGKTWEPNTTIMAKTCQCCWNRVYAHDSGDIDVIYRACDPRDMALARSNDYGKTWKKESDVGKFEWDIKSCPHMGGSVNFMKDSVQALVWTGKKDKTGLYFMNSTNHGKTWTKPEAVGSKLAREGDLANANQKLAMVWQDTQDGTETVQLKVSPDAGKTWNKPQMISTMGIHSSHPQIFALEDQFLVTWITTEKGKAKWASQILSGQ